MKMRKQKVEKNKMKMMIINMKMKIKMIIMNMKMNMKMMMKQQIKTK